MNIFEAEHYGSKCIWLYLMDRSVINTASPAGCVRISRQNSQVWDWRRSAGSSNRAVQLVYSSEDPGRDYGRL
jgi:hypothetical protein